MIECFGLKYRDNKWQASDKCKWQVTTQLSIVYNNKIVNHENHNKINHHKFLSDIF